MVVGWRVEHQHASGHDAGLIRVRIRAGLAAHDATASGDVACCGGVDVNTSSVRATDDCSSAADSGLSPGLDKSDAGWWPLFTIEQGQMRLGDAQSKRLKVGGAVDQTTTYAGPNAGIITLSMNKVGPTMGQSFRHNTTEPATCHSAVPLPSTETERKSRIGKLTDRLRGGLARISNDGEHQCMGPVIQRRWQE
jgi:hypothetical protein